ncbi:MAG TPA: c-type cytochrome [Methylomirabilota bacterium]|jgi:nitric oxide reductase subunit C
MTAVHDRHGRRRFLYLLAALTLWAHGDAAIRGSAGAAAGDAARGEGVFARLPCASCHDITRPSPGGDICPNLGSIGAEAARRVRLPDYRGKAKDAAGYIRESIVDPNAFVVPGPNYRTADGQSIMPKTFGATLTPSELDDLVAFLLTRR